MTITEEELAKKLHEAAREGWNFTQEPWGELNVGPREVYMRQARTARRLLVPDVPWSKEDVERLVDATADALDVIVHKGYDRESPIGTCITEALEPFTKPTPEQQRLERGKAAHDAVTAIHRNISSEERWALGADAVLARAREQGVIE